MGNSCCVVVADAYAPEHMQWLDHPARADWEPAVDLGAGAFSEVVLCRHRKTRGLSALKVVFTAEPGQDAETREMLLQEGALLMELDHPHLVKCYEVIPGERATVFRLEYLRGPNVLDGLARLHAAGYSERDAAGVFAQLASAVAYLHGKKVIHRDIKPENLVYAQRLDARGAVVVAAKAAPGAAAAGGKEIGAAGAADASAFAAAPAPPPEAPIVKLVDLGMAWRDADPAHPDTGALGSAGFVAPEVAAGGAHTPAMDVFSMGVLLFVMLVGRKPFNMSDCEGLGYAKLALADAPGLKDPRWLDLSPDAKDLLMGMLAYDPRRRLSAAGVLAHEWVRSGGGATVRPLGADVALGAATVAEMRRLRFLTSGVVATQQRVAAAGVAGAGGAGAARAGSGSVRGGAEAYGEALRRAQKREASARGGRGVAGLAQRITARALTNVHDSGASVHGHPLLEASVRGGGAYRGGSDGGSVSRSSRAGAAGAAGDAAGMRRSGTALLLSELARGGSGSMRRSGSVDRLAALGGAVSAYLEVSVRGGRRLGSFAVGTSQASLGSQEREAAAAAAPAVVAPPVSALAAPPPRGSLDDALGRTISVARMGDAAPRSSTDRRASVDRRSSADGRSPRDASGSGSAARRVQALRPLE
jgi:hypothetical protein